MVFIFGIFMRNIWPEYLQGIFTVHILNHTKYIVTVNYFLEYLQMCYVVDSWIEYVAE